MSSSSSTSSPPSSPAPGGPATLDRRTALKGLGALLGVGATACAAPGADKSAPDSTGPGDTGPADTGPADTGPAGDPAPTEMGWPLLRHRIDTVVVLCMENRSFDHYFGALSLLEDHPEVDGLQAEMANPHPDGSSVPVFLTEVWCLDDPPHSWSSSRVQWNGGANDGFVAAFHDRAPDMAHEAMGYFDRPSLPAFYELADAFTLCDRWFSSQLSSTWPNRFYLHCADNGGEHGNTLPSVPVESIYDRLTAAGHSWGCYYSNAPFMIVVPDRRPDEPQFMEIERFFTDAAAGTLPNVVVVDPVFGRADDHPPAHPVAGQIFVAQIYEALRQSPHWERCLFVVTYDEHGGFFDHVAPPELPDERADEGFGQAGFRVPTLVCGPYVKAGHVSHTVHDHTSVLAFLEGLFAVEPLRARDAAADPMLGVFDEAALLAGSPRPGPALSVIEADEEELFARECVTLLDGRPLPTTGQPELEAVLDAAPVRLRVDRRDQTDAIHRALVQRAEASGLVRIRPAGGAR